MLQFTFPEYKKNEKIIIEAGHIYTNQEVNPKHELGAKVGALLGNFLMGLGYETENWLFVDDYNPQFEEWPQELDLNEYQKKLTGWGFSPDLTKFEKDLVGLAQEKLEELLKTGVAGEKKKGGRIVIYGSSAQLYDPNENKYSCALLDACLYLQKLEQGDFTLTILPCFDQYGNLYYSQQQKTFQILSHLDVDPTKILPIYFFSPGEEPSQKKKVKLSSKEGHLADLVTMLKTIGKVTSETPLETGLDLGVMQYVT
ncbi:hypothetical protein HOE37_03965 [Candidatus Woesearchaeota archaeon]|jgi:hypothetical protein|nr:hypothetical protein [Candidatus Woesearchaeota archaeon]MBT4110988.1 hypothetical protein [Candidatus Woesearchaeota archaeon]MBT4336857.1 hypothetical protein [Candidatus Woesearchaeota archaeon]MBT4469828.1 hypothetical protein [Candidatus Woesearchaeota archaeon]MBT6743701.1 hypothetical protein [Candidatus Woesearchaeota archaeon]